MTQADQIFKSRRMRVYQNDHNGTEICWLPESRKGNQLDLMILRLMILRSDVVYDIELTKENRYAKHMIKSRLDGMTYHYTSDVTQKFLDEMTELILTSKIVTLDE